MVALTAGAVSRGSTRPPRQRGCQGGQDAGGSTGGAARLGKAPVPGHQSAGREDGSSQDAGQQAVRLRRHTSGWPETPRIPPAPPPVPLTAVAESSESSEAPSGPSARMRWAGGAAAASCCTFSFRWLRKSSLGGGGCQRGLVMAKCISDSSVFPFSACWYTEASVCPADSHCGAGR